MAKGINVIIAGDASKLKRALGDAERKLDGFGSKVASGVKTAGIAIAGMGVGAALMAPKVLTMGAELEALGKKSKTVFEGSLGDVRAWADELAPSLGLTTEQLVGVAAGTADLLKPMGFAADEAAKMAMETNDLAGALSAWTGGQRDAEEVSKILTKAYLGEREGLKELGISILESDVQARLAKKGQEDLTGAALQQAKALATQELILEKSTDAQKAWADGSMDGIKAQNASKASIESVKESLVSALYPALQAMLPLVEDAAKWLGENLPGAIETVRGFFDEHGPAIEAVIDKMKAAFQVIADWVQEHWPSIQETIESVMGAIQVIVETVIAILVEVWDRFGEDITRIVEGAMNVIQGVIDTVTALIRGDWEMVWDGIQQIFQGVWDAIEGIVGLALDAIAAVIDLAWEGIKEGVSLAWDGIKGLVSEGIDLVVDVVAGLPGAIADVAAGAFDAVWDAFKGVINAIISAWNSLELPGFSIGGWDPPGPGKFPKVTIPSIGLPYIQPLATGGIVTSPTLAMIGEAGPEAVIPLNGKSGMGSTYNVTVNAGIGTNGADVGRQVVEQIKRFERANGTGWRN